jgi:hypothetical protein
MAELRKWQAISLVSMAINTHNHPVRTSAITWSKVTSVDQLVDLGYDRDCATNFMHGRNDVLLLCIGSHEWVIRPSQGLKSYKKFYQYANEGTSLLFVCALKKISIFYEDRIRIKYHNNILQLQDPNFFEELIFVVHLSELHKFIDMANAFSVFT